MGNLMDMVHVRDIGYVIGSYLNLTEMLNLRLINKECSSIISLDAEYKYYSNPTNSKFFQVRNLHLQERHLDNDMKLVCSKLSDIFGFEMLVSLKMSAVTIVDGIKLLHLRKLTLEACYDIGKMTFSKFPELRMLYLSCCEGKITEHLYDLKNLETFRVIDISPDLYDHSDIRKLTKLKDFEFVRYFTGPNMSNNDLASLVNLRSLCLHNHDLITPDVFVNFKNLRSLEIGYCENITDVALKYVPKLKKLTIYGNSITDKGLSYVTDLEYLYISSGNIITDVGIEKLLRLKKLMIKSNSHISDVSVMKLVNLEYLDISRPSSITPCGISKLAKLRVLIGYIDAFRDVVNKSKSIREIGINDISIYDVTEYSKCLRDGLYVHR